MPCEEITPIILNWSGDCNVTISNVNDSTINYSINMTPYGVTGQYNFSFNVNYSNSSETDYLLTLCDNSTSTVTIIYSETANQLWYIYLFFFMVFAIIFVVGEWRDNFLFKYIAGAFLLVVGLYIFINGIPGNDLTWLGSGDSDAWLSLSAWIFIGLGLIYTLRTIYQNVWGGVSE